MHPIRMASLSAVFFCFTLGLTRAESATSQTDVQPMLSESDYGTFQLKGTDVGNAAFSVQPVSGPGYNHVLRLQTTKACITPYAAQIVQGNRETIHKGDALIAHFYLRTIQSTLESGEGFTEFVIENATSFNKSVKSGASALGEWREFFIPFTASEDYLPGQASIIFRMGYNPQIIEIAGLTVKDFGPRDSFGESPAGPEPFSYAGQEADAPWRAEAERRIEKIRKATLTIHVVDEAGDPVKGAKITVRQTRHAYWFGSAVRADHIAGGDPEEQARYKSAIKEMFNAVTFENDLKWRFWMRDPAATLSSAKWLSEQEIALRGHVMVWPGRELGLPDTLSSLEDNPDQLRKAILGHISEVTAKLQPPAAAWDVLNETFKHHEFMDVLGQYSMVTWFQAAHQCTPESRLFINDYGIVTELGMNTKHQDDYESTISYLLDNKAPLDGIGLQGHFGKQPTGPEHMLAVLDRFGKFGKEIQMTEYSTQFADPKNAAAYLRDCLTVFFSHSSTTGFILWGFHDGTGMKNRSFLYDKDWNLTPSGQVWKDLVFGKWWTNTQAVSGEDGKATADGFLGQYEITVRVHGAETKGTVELKSGGSGIKIVCKT